MESYNVPEVDMMMVSKNSQYERESLLKFAPPVGLTNISYGGMYKVDSFYLECQKYRDQFRDPYNKLLRPKMFSTYRGKCGIKIDPELERLKRPAASHVESIPVVYPIEYGRKMDFDRGFQMEGRNSRESAIARRYPCVRVLGR
ncbi:uncharacterized protein [Drosophila suzukii]|uniref:Uncharacterized protein n=1 Tax=Drosophila suzukii TaxID=28584 RepID=A0AB40A6W2_DROSZ